VKSDFEWDTDKAERNIRNHGVSFDEAKEEKFYADSEQL